MSSSMTLPMSISHSDGRSSSNRKGLSHYRGYLFVSQYLESLATRHVWTTTHRHAHTPGARRPPHHTQTQSSRAWQRSAAMCWSSTVL